MIRIFAILIVTMVCQQGFAEAVWRAGTARARITPDELLPMAGYGARNVPAEGKLTELWAKALVLEDAVGKRGVLITLDLVGIHRTTSQRICQRLEQQHDLKRDQIVLNCSHTHTGPAVGKNLGPLHYYLLPEPQRLKLDQYEQSLIDTLVDLVNAAIGDLEPCTLTHGTGLSTFAVNRRENRQDEVPEKRQLGSLAGPFDHSLPVLVVRDSSLAVKTILFGYACHATVLSVRMWSGDYPGFAQAALENRYPGSIAMFWSGCGADQNPVPRRSVELARQYGERLAAAVAEVIAGTVRPIQPNIETRYREIDLPLTDLPTLAELRVTAERAGEKYEQARARYLLDRLGDRESLDASYPYPVATWLLGDQLTFVFLGGEVVVDYALQLKSDAGPEQHPRTDSVWVAGYSNDVMAYIPSRRVLREGGYEGGGSNVYYGLPGLWSPEIERLILDEVDAQFKVERPASRNGSARE